MVAADIECLVVGAGVAGLAIARALARAGLATIVAESADGPGQGISSRNSEVIHAGLYYPPGSHKARLCVSGKTALYRFCKDFNVAHRRCGKIVVAPDRQHLPQLEAIAARARGNGVEDIALLSPNDILAMEPALRGAGGLFSPSTGIIDSHGLMLALLGDFEACGGALARNCPVVSARLCAAGIAVETGGAAPTRIVARRVVLAAGLSSPGLAHTFEGLDRRTIPAAWFAKGSYFSLSRRAPFTRLIYPVPEPGGLGVHLTLDLAGRARFGPDVEWLDARDPNDIDYTVDPARADRFYAAIRRYWPDLRDGELAPDYSGVRPKIVPPGAPDADFLIRDHTGDGMPGLIALYGVESPGLTCALAIGEHVAQTIAHRA